MLGLDIWHTWISSKTGANSKAKAVLPMPVRTAHALDADVLPMKPLIEPVEWPRSAMTGFSVVLVSVVTRAS